MTAQLIGIGVGSGDKDLITLKAYKLLQSADADTTVIAYIKPPQKPSMARGIVDAYLPDCHITEIVLTMPMRTDTHTATAIYNEGADRIVHVLRMGKTVLFLCEGDPLFYGSFMYIYDRLHPQVKIDIVPGIASVSAACSVAKIPFASRNDVCVIVPATGDIHTITHHIRSADSIAIIKIGRHLDKIKTALTAANKIDMAVCVQYATMPQQKITPVKHLSKAPYFSIILVTKNTLY